MKDAYTRKFLIEKYPHLKAHIRAGDFRVILDENGRTRIQWTNVAILAPTGGFVGQAIHYFFPACAPEQIRFGTCGLNGIEITADYEPPK